MGKSANYTRPFMCPLLWVTPYVQLVVSDVMSRASEKHIPGALDFFSCICLFGTMQCHAISMKCYRSLRIQDVMFFSTLLEPN